MSRSKAFNPADLQTDAGRKRFYSSDNWTRTRAYKLSVDPVCQCAGCTVCSPGADRACAKAATHVDHIAPLRVSPMRALDEDNLQSLCHACHSAKTAVEKTTMMSDSVRKDRELIERLKAERK